MSRLAKLFLAGIVLCILCTVVFALFSWRQKTLTNQTFSEISISLDSQIDSHQLAFGSGESQLKQIIYNLDLFSDRGVIIDQWAALRSNPIEHITITLVEQPLADDEHSFYDDMVTSTSIFGIDDEVTASTRLFIDENTNTLFIYLLLYPSTFRDESLIEQGTKIANYLLVNALYFAHQGPPVRNSAGETDLQTLQEATLSDHYPAMLELRTSKRFLEQLLSQLHNQLIPKASAQVVCTSWSEIRGVLDNRSRCTISGTICTDSCQLGQGLCLPPASPACVPAVTMSCQPSEWGCEAVGSVVPGSPGGAPCMYGPGAGSCQVAGGGGSCPSGQSWCGGCINGCRNTSSQTCSQIIQNECGSGSEPEPTPIIPIDCHPWCHENPHACNEPCGWACERDPWQNRGCGGSGHGVTCSANQMYQERAIRGFCGEPGSPGDQRGRCVTDDVSCCVTTNPAPPALSEPANNAIVNGAVPLRWQNTGSWGQGCPTNNNQSRAQYSPYIGTSCSTNWVDIPWTSNSSVGFTPPTPGQSYCWRVRRTNGSLTTYSAPRVVRTCVASAWTAQQCGGSAGGVTCSARQQLQTRTFNHGAACGGVTARCVDLDNEGQACCQPTQWQDNACGAGSCGREEMQQTRIVNGCNPNTVPATRCVANTSCLPDSWWQAQGGNVYSAQRTGTAMRSIVPGYACTEPNCSPNLLATVRSLASVQLTDGVLITAGGAIQADGYYTPRNRSVIGSELTRYRENYEFFYRKSTLGLEPTDHFTSTRNDARRPNSSGTYFSAGNLTIEQQWNVGSAQRIIIFVDGNLTFSDISGIQRLIRVQPGGFLAFIVRGDIIINHTVGNTSPTNNTPNLEGVYIADGRIRVLSDGNNAVSDRRFIGQGTFVGWSGVTLDRNFNNSSTGRELNRTIPSETFIHRPDLLFAIPDWMQHSTRIWQERN